MKKIVTALICLALLAMTATAVMAAPDKGNYGDVPLYTGDIEIDGVIDDVFTEYGLAIDLSGDCPGGYASESTGFAYMLHDGTDVYVAITINNSHPFVLPDAVIDSGNAWKETGIEFYFDWNGDGKTFCKWILWPDGQYYTEEKYSTLAPNEFKDYAASVDGQTYTIELCVTPVIDVKLDSDIGWYVMVNSHEDPATPKQQFIAVPKIQDGVDAANNASLFANLKLSSKEVVLPEPEVVEEAVTTAPTTTTTTTTAPSTSDITVVLVALSTAISAGVLTLKKKH